MVDKGELPGFYAKRKVLFGAKTSPEKLREMGEMFLAADRHDDALEFFARCRAVEPARRIARTAMEAGNVPLYMRAKRVLAEEITDQEWTQLAGNAEKAGAYMMAFVAHRKAGHEEEAARVRQLIPGPQMPQKDELPSEGRAGA